MSHRERAEEVPVPWSVGILGTGSYLPAEEVSNHTVAARAGVTADWIVERTGILSRRYAAESEATSDLAVAAALDAVHSAGISVDDLGWILVATATPDRPQPPTACLVQHRIGAAGAVAVDVNAVCSGFVFGMVMAAKMLGSGAGSPPGPGSRSRDYALVIGADLYSRVIDRSDRRTAVLLGDGAGAVVLGPVPGGYGILGSDLRSFGEHHDIIKVEAGGSRIPASEKTVADGQHYFRMDGRAVRDFVMAELPCAVDRLLGGLDIDPADVDHFIPHQANAVLLRRTLPSLGLSRATSHLTVDRHGNTGAASVPLALDTVHRRGDLEAGDLVLMAGFGGGMSMGVLLLRWGTTAPVRGGEVFVG